MIVRLSENPLHAARLDDHRQSRQQGHVALTDIKTGMQLADSLFKNDSGR